MYIFYMSIQGEQLPTAF